MTTKGLAKHGTLLAKNMSFRNQDISIKRQVELIQQDIPEPLEMLKMLKFNDNEIYEERIKHQKKNIIIREKLEQAKNNLEYMELL